MRETRVENKTKNKTWTTRVIGVGVLLFVAGCMPKQTDTQNSDITAFPAEPFLIAPGINVNPIKAPVQEGGQDPGGGSTVPASNDDVIKAIDRAWAMANEKNSNFSIFVHFADYQLTKAVELSSKRDQEQLLQRKLRAAEDPEFFSPPHPLLKKHFDVIIRTFGPEAEVNREYLEQARKALKEYDPSRDPYQIASNPKMNGLVSPKKLPPPIYVEGLNEWRLPLYLRKRVITPPGMLATGFSQLLRESKLHKKLNGPCKGLDGKPHEAAVSKFERGGTICISVQELQKYPRESLLQQILGIIAHEAVHLNGYRDETVARDVQKIFLEFLPNDINLASIESAKTKAIGKIEKVILQIQEFEAYQRTLNESNRFAEAEEGLKAAPKKIKSQFAIFVGLAQMLDENSFVLFLPQSQRLQIFKKIDSILRTISAFPNEISHANWDLDLIPEIRDESLRLKTMLEEAL